MTVDAAPSGGDARAGADGLVRCPWALSAPEYVDYHDLEWGRPVLGVTELYERMTLEAFQSGLTWLTILRKRPGFRRAFADFRPEVVAAFGPDDVARLMADPAIVRNRAKIDAAIHNARAVANLGDELARLVWDCAEPDRPRPVTLAEVPAWTPASKTLALALKKHGIRFVGPTTAYAMLQATGVVDDHLRDCQTAP